MKKRGQRPGSETRAAFPIRKRGPDMRWYDPANLRPQSGSSQARWIGYQKWSAAHLPPVHDEQKKRDEVVRRTRARKIRKRAGVCRECDRRAPGHTLCLVHRRLACMRAHDAYLKLRAAGVCATCHVTRAAPGRVHCRACGLARRQITSDQRRKHTRLAAGLCPRCTSPLAEGRQTCAGCLSDKRAATRARLTRWAAAGLCMKCGKAREDPSLLHCFHCRAQSARYKKRYAADGFCGCGRFCVPGRKACETCLRVHREYQRRRRAAAKAALPGV